MGCPVSYITGKETKLEHTIENGDRLHATVETGNPEATFKVRDREQKPVFIYLTAKDCRSLSLMLHELAEVLDANRDPAPKTGGGA
jgi:hypothetical protein